MNEEGKDNYFFGKRTTLHCQSQSQICFLEGGENPGAKVLSEFLDLTNILHVIG